MKIIWHDPVNHCVVLFDALYLDFGIRAGSTFAISPECFFMFGKGLSLLHVRGWYIQIGKFGGTIAFKSNICYENK